MVRNRNCSPVSTRRRSAHMVVAWLVLYLLAGCFLSSYALGQDKTKPADPPTMETVYLLDPANHDLKPLAKDPAKVVSGRKGFSGGKGAIQIPAPASSFRVKSGKDLEFVVTCPDPARYELFAFTPKGNNREALVATAKGKFFGGATTERVGRLPFEVSKYGESSYRFVLKAPQPGEYGFAVGWFVYNFAVDAN